MLSILLPKGDLKMKIHILMLISVLSSSVYADFQKEAPLLAQDLKANLLQELTHQVQTNGVEAAIPFCHTNVKSLAKNSAKERIEKYNFGRTSHKIRNEQNLPKDWMKPLLDKYQGTTFNKDKTHEYKIFGTLPDGKKYYAEPLFVGAQCLSCHGENVTKTVKDKINVFYPNDRATGFKAQEFRGFIWVSEK